MDMTHNEFILLISTCWNQTHQPLIIDMTKDEYKSCYRLRLNSIFFPAEINFNLMN